MNESTTTEPPGFRGVVIVPAYNEEESISLVLTELAEHAPAWSVVVVDDGSTDATSAIARSHPGVHVLTLPFNLGIGGAMQAGYRFALRGGFTHALQVDADGQHDPREIPKLLAVLAADPTIDMVVGTRFLEPDSDGFKSSAARRVGIGIFARLLSRIVGERVTDPTSGFRLVRRTGIELFATDYPHDFPEVEAIVMMHAHRLRATETAVVMRERAGGQSSIGRRKSAYYMVKVTIAVVMALLRRRPLPNGSSAPAPVEPSTRAHEEVA